MLMQRELCWHKRDSTFHHFLGSEIHRINIFNIFIFALGIYNRWSDIFTQMKVFKLPELNASCHLLWYFWFGLNTKAESVIINIYSIVATSDQIPNIQVLGEPWWHSFQTILTVMSTSSKTAVGTSLASDSWLYFELCFCLENYQSEYKYECFSYLWIQVTSTCLRRHLLLLKSISQKAHRV